MTCGTLLHILYRELHVMLKAVYRSVLCSVVHICAAYITQSARKQQVDYQHDHFYHALEQTHYKHIHAVRKYVIEIEQQVYYQPVEQSGHNYK